MAPSNGVCGPCTVAVPTGKCVDFVAANNFSCDMADSEYELVIRASDDSIKFVVQERARFEKIRVPLLFVLLGVLIKLVSIYRNECYDGLARIAVVVVLGALTYCRQEREDTMIVMKNIGVQLYCKSRWKFLPRNDKNIFIPSSNIIDLVIHEGFYGYGQVIYYLCVLTKNTGDKDDMIKVVFSELLPRKTLLVDVWKQSRTMLFGENKKFFRRVPGQGLKLVE